jgi:hypothetical protein
MKNAVIICLLALLCGCEFGDFVNGSGNIEKETRSESGFTGIAVSGPMDVELTQGGEFSIEVEADDNIIPYILTEKEGRTLQIKTRDNANLQTSGNILVKITMPEVREISIGGSGAVKTMGRISNSDKLELDVAGSGDMELNVKSPSISAHIAGSGKIVAEGETQKIDVHIAGSGDFLAENLKSEEVKVSVGGSGNAKVFASRELDVSVAGSGNIYYRGDPTNIKKSIAGSGNVEKMN